MAKTTRKGKTMHTKRANSWRVKSRKGEPGFVGEHKNPPPLQTETLLTERGATHGSFFANGNVSQGIKDVMHRSQNWFSMSLHRREALDLIATKISRICSGIEDFPDHWDDIAGYAKLGKAG